MNRHSHQAAKIILVIVLCVTGIGCSRGPELLTNTYNSAMFEKALRDTIDKVNDLREDFEIEKIRHGLREQQIDCKSNGFKGIQSSLGLLLIQCETATQYLDGYRLTLEIGNPSSMTYIGLNLVFRTKQQQTANTDGFHIDIADSIRPGEWNKISFVVHPLKPGELSDLSIQVDAKNVGLK